MKIVLAQVNPRVGDLGGNIALLKRALASSEADACDLLVFPELFLTAYPPRDLLEKPWFIRNVENALEEIKTISRAVPQKALLLGAPTKTGKTSGRGLYNSALLIRDGQIVFTQHKSLLPTYDVFDEARYFDPAPTVEVFEFKGLKLGINICEDAWNDPAFWPRGGSYQADPLKNLAEKGADIFINISSSPFHLGKERTRLDLMRENARRFKRPFIYVNQVGANDELIFDGGSFALDAQGQIIAQAHYFDEQLLAVESTGEGRAAENFPQSERMPALYAALVLGIKDYFCKCGFPPRALIGLSGGIDSALAACLVSAAIGPENVLGITMPSVYSSTGSIEDSRQLAKNLGIDFKIIPITQIFDAYLATLKTHFEAAPPGIAEENVQARIRGNLLMAFSNKFSRLLITTGNKSELAVGYCTLYGDMSGGLSVISDVPKTMIYELAAYINREREIIPKASILKAPSAELRPDQTDQDTLPPYAELDAILQDYIENNLSRSELTAKGFKAETVDWVVSTVNNNEYKRRQAAPGLKVTSKAFGIGRRMPIAAKLEP